ncbi:MAG: enoyl-CoA hydratase-related protein [Pseudomonadota bacterium]|nr:enoyl-CoA hydratase-related protein [Pseudomonadota bacterium]
MSFVLTERLGHDLHVKLNRPTIHNAFNLDIIKELIFLFSKKNLPKDVRVIVLSGEGPSFCAGGDLEWMKSMVKYTNKQNLKDAEQLYEMFDTIFQCPVPVIGRVHGNVRGGGLGLASVCDIVVAESNTLFGFSEAHLGLVPSVICPFVARKMSEASLRELMVTGKIFSAQRAYDSGLVHFVGDKNNIEKFIVDTISSIHKCGPEAIQITKSLIDFIFTNPLSKAKTKTARIIAERRVSSEGQEGMRAFLEKRPPTWRISDL